MFDCGIHNSNAIEIKITSSGLFGGIFASASGGMYGANKFRVSSPRHLSNFELNYSIDGAWDVAVELCDGDESLAEIIMTPGCESEDGYEAQAMRGKLAAKLGFTSVEMEDENGFSVLCLPGCTCESV